MSETPPEPVPTPCHGCGATDTAPKIQTAYHQWQKDEKTIIVDPDFHYDCLPAEIDEQVFGPGNAVTRAAIDAARSGVKDDELREFIQAQPDDNDLAPELVDDETEEN